MRKPTLVVVPLLLAGLLGGCVAGSDEPPPNPVSDLEKAIDLIPWAKSIAADASADELTARITEITANLGPLDLPQSKRAEIEAKLHALHAEITADPSDTSAHAAELNAILDEIKAAVQ